MAVRATDSVTLAVLPSPSYVRTYYQLRSSTLSAPPKPTTNPPPAPWTTSEPNYSPTSTDTLYTTMLTVYGTAGFEYGDVQKSSSYEAAKQAYNLADTANASASKALGLYNTLVVADFTNHFNDPEFQKSGYTYWTRVVTNGVAGLEMTGVGAQRGAYVLGTAMNVEADARYLLAINRLNVTGGVGKAGVYIRRYSGLNGTGTLVGTTLALDIDAAEGEYRAEYTVPAGTGSLVMGFFIQSTVTSTTRVRLENYRMRRMEAGEVFVDGSLTALTLTGARIQTSPTGNRVVMDDGNRIRLVYDAQDGTTAPEMYTDIQPSEWGLGIEMRPDPEAGILASLDFGNGGYIGGIDWGGEATLIVTRSGGQALLQADQLYGERVIQAGEPIAYRMAAGKVTNVGPSLGQFATQNYSVTFPSGRFDFPPIVTASCESGRMTIAVQSITATGCVLQMQNNSNGSGSQAPIHWQAIQMLTNASAG